MPDSHNAPLMPQSNARRDSDDALLADLTAPPSLEDAQEAYDYWTRRGAELPRHKRRERKEAEQMAVRWKERLATARRERYGSGLLDQLLDALGIRWRPNLRRIKRLGVLVLGSLMLILVLLLVLIGVFWHDIEPVVQTLINQGSGGGGG